MSKRELLFTLKTKKFDQICALVAHELGYGEFAAMNREMRAQVEMEARHYVKEWEETTELRAVIRPMTPLRRLLNQYQDICDRILDENDIESGLWAYRMGLKRRAPLRQAQ
ncbi:MAG: hypothetical protein FJX44_05325 [Alphaproteobacteria bacterium]|nr:hypothetical protein [Alphaproteobacteria bacterium]